MPRFNVDSIDIDPDDYVNECGEGEIKELLEEIKRSETEIYEDFIKDDVEEEIQEQEDGLGYMDNLRSESHRVFNNNLRALKMGYYSVSKEDADIIAILAKKYGAL